MKQETKEKKKPKSITQKAKKVRSIVMMTLLCILMLSASTYAWFTLSNTAKVSNLTMTVGDVTGLQVADYEGTDTAPADETKWKSETTAVEFKGKLMPATTTDGISFSKPDYNENGEVGSVSSTNAKLDNTAATTDASEGYYVEYYFWIRAKGADGASSQIQLDAGAALNDGIYSDTGSPTGTYSLSKNVTVSDILPSAAVRISLQKGSETSAAVLEPNADYNTAASQIATDNSGGSVMTSTVTQKKDGTFSSANSNVFTLTNNTPTKITLRIWLEGKDLQCGNEIAAKDIVSQLKFSVVTP